MSNTESNNDTNNNRTRHVYTWNEVQPWLAEGTNRRIRGDGVRSCYVLGFRRSKSCVGLDSRSGFTSCVAGEVWWVVCGESGVACCACSTSMGPGATGSRKSHTRIVSSCELLIIWKSSNCRRKTLPVCSFREEESESSNSCTWTYVHVHRWHVCYCYSSSSVSITMSVLTQRLSVGALGSSAAWKSHTFIALNGDE